jgi:prolyl-tRNA editing enzyme YbaK/EbsC (Cys-tRNA(Pro) deacylase)
MGPDDIRDFLAAGAIDGEIVLMDIPTPTVEMAAQAVGRLPRQIIKSLLFLVNSQPVLVITGYPVGAMPPFPHPQPLPTLIDRQVLQQPLMYGGGGGECALPQLSPVELLRLTEAQVMDLTSPPRKIEQVT